MQQDSTILIVDDEQFGRDTLEGLLTNRGYELVFAHNGPEALAKVEATTPDVILLDVMMPEMNGFEVCKRIRATPHLAEIPIILLTALGDYNSRLMGIKAGADDFITKPFDAIELRARIHTTTRLNRYRRLKEQRARFEWVVEQADDGYLVVNERDKILYLNSMARLYLDLPADAAHPVSGAFLDEVQKQYQLQPPELWSAWPAVSDRDLATPRYLVRPECDNAEAFWLLVTLFEGPAKEDTGRIIRLRNVTPQMVLQRDMRGFHLSVLHKLRTPLTIANSSLQLLVEHAPQLSVEEIVDFSKTAFLSLKRLNGVVEDVLQYAHLPALPSLQSGFRLDQTHKLLTRISMTLDLRYVSLSGLDQLNKKRLKLSKQAVELIFFEVLENAKKFHPEKNPTVDVSFVGLDEQNVVLKISDNGLTLSPEQLDQVWLPYYQGEKYFTGELEGTGLGLSTVALLVWGVGGRCVVYNRPTEPGVTIELTLPLA